MDSPRLIRKRLAVLSNSNRFLAVTDLGSRLVRLLLAIVVVLVCGCTGETDEPLENTVEQTYNFPLGGELTVRNAEGSIRIY